MASTEDRLRIAGVVEESITDGPGLRFTVFTQGCPHHCPGCHNPQTHAFSGGAWLELAELVAAMGENPLLQGLSISGGEPFCQPGPCAALARAAHQLGGDVWVWSGWTYEQLREKAQADPDISLLLAETDVLVDGLYIEAERDLSLPWRGSRNQRIIKLK